MDGVVNSTFLLLTIIIIINTKYIILINIIFSDASNTILKQTFLLVVEPEVFSKPPNLRNTVR